MIFLLVVPSMVSAQLVHPILFDSVKIVDSGTNADYSEIELNGAFSGAIEEGAPLLPSKTVLLSIPAGSEIASVEIKNPKIETITLTKKILPFQGIIPINETVEPKVFIEPLESIYASDSYYPEQQANVAHTGYFDYVNRIASITVCPFKYEPKKNLLLFYSSFDLYVTFKPQTQSRSRQTQIRRQRSEEQQNEYDRILNTLVDNPQALKQNTVEPVIPAAKAATTLPKELSYEYVVVTSAALAPAFERFVAWKRRKGLNIGIVTMDYIRSHYSGDLISGIYDDAGKLRQFLFDAYKNNLVYALLGGDINNVPIRIGDGSNNSVSLVNKIPTDLYFSDFNGNWNVDGDNCYGERTQDAPDYFAEIFIGRVLCSTSEHIENWTEKLIRYENNPGNGDYSYLRKAFYTQADQMQGADWAGSVKSKFTMFSTTTIFNEMTNGVLDSCSIGLPTFPTGKDVIDEFNKGYGFTSFMGHGSACGVSVANRGYAEESPRGYGVYTSESVHPEYNKGGELTRMNNFNYPNINYSISCENMPYDGGENSKHVNHKDNFGKYITVMSKAGCVAFLGHTRNGWVYGSLNIFLDFGNEIRSGNYNLGIAEANSKSKATSTYQYLIYSHNLLGCPETSMWTGTPSTFLSGTTVIENGSSVTVNARTTGCQICVMSANDNGIAYHQVKKGVSSATFTNVPKPYSVTVTKHNYIPFLYPDDLFIQNKTYNSNNYYITGNNIHAGSSVTNTQTEGPVVIEGSSNIVFDANGDIVLDKGFEVKKGAQFESK